MVRLITMWRPVGSGARGQMYMIFCDGQWRRRPRRRSWRHRRHCWHGRIEQFGRFEPRRNRRLYVPHNHVSKAKFPRGPFFARSGDHCSASSFRQSSSDFNFVTEHAQAYAADLIIKVASGFCGSYACTILERYGLGPRLIAPRETAISHPILVEITL